MPQPVSLNVKTTRSPSTLLLMSHFAAVGHSVKRVFEDVDEASADFHFIAP
jgi:hypothetical protein